MDMNDKQKLSRGQFLTVVGGMALTAVLIKFSGAKNIIAAAGNRGNGAMPSGSYGNNTYGGKNS